MAAKKKNNRKQTEAIHSLEKIAQKIGLRVSYGDMKFAGLRLKGGHCIFKDEHWLVLNRKDDHDDKVDLFLEAFAHFDLSNLDIPADVERLLKPITITVPAPESDGSEG